MPFLTVLCVWVLTVLAPAAAGQQSPPCEVTELSIGPLVLNGRHDTYVEPETLVRAGDAVLLAGHPTYVLRTGPGGEPVSLTRDSLVGVILEPDGGVRGLSRPPVGGTPIEWRAVALDEREWGVTFTEVPVHDMGSVGTSVDGRLWYGAVRDGRWASLARIPLPAGWNLLPFSASTLARGGDTLALAVSMDSAALVRRVVLFERRQGRWSHRALPFGAAYVDLAHANGIGFAAAVARADSSVMSGSNALYVQVPLSGGALTRVDARGAHEVHEPALAGDSGQMVLTWWTVNRGPHGSRFQAYAMVDPLASPPGAVHALDPDVDSIVHVPTPEGVNLWLADHLLADASRELRLLEASTGAVRVLWRAPNPFDGYFHAVALTGRRILLVGPTFDRSRDVLANLMLHVELKCDPSSGSRLSSVQSVGTHSRSPFSELQVTPC